MVGCCMSIYDTWHGHVHRSITSWQRHDCQQRQILRMILHLHLMVA